MEPKLGLAPETLRGYIEYLRDLGVYDLFRTGESTEDAALLAWHAALQQRHEIKPGISPGARGVGDGDVRGGTGAGSAVPLQGGRPSARPLPSLTPFEQQAARRAEGHGAGSTSLRGASRPGTRSTGAPDIVITAAVSSMTPGTPDRRSAPPVAKGVNNTEGHDDWGESGILSGEMPAPVSFNRLAPLPQLRIAPAERASALKALRAEIGDCTRCPLAYAGRHSIVFADGDAEARLMFVGEGPGADEDASGLPFVGKAGQLLNNMIQAMGLKRESVYIANIVKCRPPRNRTPEPVEANTCSPFLLRQIDLVQPQVIVALGGTAATYLLGVKQSLASLRGQWFDVRGSKCAVTYHPAFLLRDPRQKGEAWKDLQRVMMELHLEPPARA